MNFKLEIWQNPQLRIFSPVFLYQKSSLHQLFFHLKKDDETGVVACVCLTKTKHNSLTLRSTIKTQHQPSNTNTLFLGQLVLIFSETNTSTAEAEGSM